ncbi:uncharacterized protein LOC113293346 [Papaver somniferum]|uniref:uncharacterized protein LOC113293346 n=1 Tax=Papaver somniferum TaxID=3469 RepID=UPI000E7058AB|nr:uncharacterized protein LOC113293346 [Papaver somniferum]
MGWKIVYQFRKAQSEIDRYLKLVPLITLIDNASFKERLKDIERDQRMTQWEKMVLQTQFSQVRTPVAVTPLPPGIATYHIILEDLDLLILNRCILVKVVLYLFDNMQLIVSNPTIAWDEAKCFPKLYDAIPAPATMASWTKNECEETWEPTTTDAATTSEASASMVKYHGNLMECGYRALIFRGCKLKKVVRALKRMCFSGIP